MRRAAWRFSSWCRVVCGILALAGIFVARASEVSSLRTPRDAPESAPRVPLRNVPLDGSRGLSSVSEEVAGPARPSSPLVGPRFSDARRSLGEALLGRVAELEHLLETATSALTQQLRGAGSPQERPATEQDPSSPASSPPPLSSLVVPGARQEAELSAAACWASPGYTAPTDEGGRGGILVQGRGCSACHVGDTCSFFIRIQGPAAVWKGVPPLSAFKWDLMVTLSGPSLGHADVSMLSADADAHSLIATYRVWDAGTYRVLVRGPCMNLWFPGRKPKSDLVAEWTLEVLPAAQPSPGVSLLVPLPSPCDYTLHARWLLQPNGTYRWTPFACSPSWLKAQEVPSALEQRQGIREINLVGDSRLRVLALHLHHLFVAGEGNAEQATYPYHRVERHGNVSLAVPLLKDGEEGGRGRLTLNFYFADFILAEEEFGCKRLNSSLPRGWMPEVSPTADVTILNVGSWTGTFCKEAELAISSHIEGALRWAHSKTKSGSHVILRSASSMYRGMGCRVTNSFLHFANTLAQAFCPRFGAVYFDTWQIEAPLFSNTCSLHDHHYSCIRRLPGGAAMHGEVGEAVAVTFLHFLLHMLR